MKFILLMASLMAMVSISIDAMLPALGTIGRDLAVTSPNQPQYILGFLFIGMMVGQLIAGPLSDAIGRKKILNIGLGIFFCGSLICYLAPDLPVMLIGRTIQGLGVACPYVLTVAIVRDKYHGNEMARVLSLVMTIFILMPAIAPSIGQAVLFWGHWRNIFLLYMVLSAALFFWMHYALEETLHPEDVTPFSVTNLKHGFREVWGCRMTVFYTLAMGFCFGGFIGYLNSAQQIFQDFFQTGKLFTVYFGALALVFGAASMLNTRLLEKWGMQKICTRSVLGIILSSLAFLLWMQLSEIHLWHFILYIAVLLFSLGLLFGNLNALAMEKMGHIAGLASAIISTSSEGVSLVISTFIGQAYNHTLYPVTIGFLSMGILTWWMMQKAGRVVE